MASAPCFSLFYPPCTYPCLLPVASTQHTHIRASPEPRALAVAPGRSLPGIQHPLPFHCHPGWLSLLSPSSKPLPQRSQAGGPVLGGPGRAEGWVALSPPWCSSSVRRSQPIPAVPTGASVSILRQGGVGQQAGATLRGQRGPPGQRQPRLRPAGVRA